MMNKFLNRLLSYGGIGGARTLAASVKADDYADLRAEIGRLNSKIAAFKEVGRILREERNRAIAERDEARAELALWKPRRDAKGHFVKAEAAPVAVAN